jgi:hypothetical protein
VQASFAHIYVHHYPLRTRFCHHREIDCQELLLLAFAGLLLLLLEIAVYAASRICGSLDHCLTLDWNACQHEGLPALPVTRLLCVYCRGKNKMLVLVFTRVLAVSICFCASMTLSGACGDAFGVPMTDLVEAYLPPFLFRQLLSVDILNRRC